MSSNDPDDTDSWDVPLTGSGLLTISGTSGEDRLRALAGAELPDGGTGRDLVTYMDSTAAVAVKLATGLGYGGYAEGDWLISIENLTGSIFNDRLSGDDRSNVLKGGAGDDALGGNGGNDRLLGGDGNDHLTGGSGADTLIGGDGDDWIHYYDSPAAVTVSLQTHKGSGGHAEGDSINSVENIHGSRHDDVLTGNAADNLIYGDSGNDTLRGRDGNDVLRGGVGADVLNGGRGIDWASYADARDGVVVDLAAGTGSHGEALGDRLVAIENLQGSAHNDVLTGDGGANVLTGGNGYDTLHGEGGNDRLDGGRHKDFLTGGDGEDKILGGSGDDLIDGGTGRDVIKGGAGDDIIYGGPDPDVICYDFAWEDITATYVGSDYSIWVDAPDGRDHIFTALTIATTTGTYRFDVPTKAWVNESAMTGDDWLA